MWRFTGMLILTMGLAGRCSRQDTPQSHSALADLPRGPVAKYYLRNWAEQQNEGQGYEIATSEGLQAVEHWLQDNARAVKESEALPNLAMVPAPGNPSYNFYRVLKDSMVVPIPLMSEVPRPKKPNRYPYPDEWVDNLPDAEVRKLRSIFEKYGTVSSWDPDPWRAPTTGSADQ